MNYIISLPPTVTLLIEKGYDFTIAHFQGGYSAELSSLRRFSALGLTRNDAINNLEEKLQQMEREG